MPFKGMMNKLFKKQREKKTSAGQSLSDFKCFWQGSYSGIMYDVDSYSL